MSVENPEQTCPGCRSTNLCPGTVRDTTTFRPSDAGLFSLNYPVMAFVCLDCGLVGQRMDGATLERLRAKRP
jgi:hypothetical protein